MNSTRYSTITLTLIGIWFLAAVAIGVLHVLPTDAGAPPIGLGLTVFTPLLVFGAWFSASKSFREFVLGLDRSVLTMIHATRTEGFVFLVLYANRLLPGRMALPAGWGDILIGVTAPLVAMYLSKPSQKTGFVVWQLLGCLDLVSAIALASTAGLVDPTGIPMTPMTELPMSLIPTFGVPLFLILHFICLAQVWGNVAAGRLLFARGEKAVA